MKDIWKIGRLMMLEGKGEENRKEGEEKQNGIDKKHRL